MGQHEGIEVDIQVFTCTAVHVEAGRRAKRLREAHPRTRTRGLHQHTSERASEGASECAVTRTGRQMSGACGRTHSQLTCSAVAAGQHVELDGDGGYCRRRWHAWAPVLRPVATGDIVEVYGGRRCSSPQPVRSVDCRVGE